MPEARLKMDELTEIDFETESVVILQKARLRVWTPKQVGHVQCQWAAVDLFAVIRHEEAVLTSKEKHKQRCPATTFNH